MRFIRLKIKYININHLKKGDDAKKMYNDNEAVAEMTAEKTTEEIIREAGLDPDDLPEICKKLYPFQIRNVLDVVARKAALLAWQMGAGKTYGGGALAEIWGDKILIVLSPKSVVDQWEQHLKAETSRKVYNSYRKGDVERFLVAFGSKALCISDDTYKADSQATLRRYINGHAEETTMICDESSRLGDYKSARTKAVLYTKVAHRILLSGTPASGGKLEKLRPQMRMLGWPMSKDEFFDNFTVTEDKIIGAGKLVRKPVAYRNIDKLRQGLIEHGASFINMSEAGIQLPETMEISVTCTPPTEYKRLMRSGIVTIDGVQIIGDFAAGRLMASRQLCGAYCAAKLNRLAEILEECAGERVVIFYCFKLDYEKLQAVCHKVDRSTSFVNGKGKDLTSYENDSDSVTLIQYQSGSLGLNLQKARISIFFDPCLSYSDYAQAKARTHRLGQKNGCVFYKMICKGSVEEKIYETLVQRGTYNKILFAEQFGVPLEPASAASAISEDEEGGAA